MSIFSPDDYVPESNFEVTMERLLNKEMVTYYLLDKSEKQNIRNAFHLGFKFCQLGYKSRGIK